jgi:hypothetical protein
MEGMISVKRLLKHACHEQSWKNVLSVTDPSGAGRSGMQTDVLLRKSAQPLSLTNSTAAFDLRVGTSVVAQGDDKVPRNVEHWPLQSAHPTAGSAASTASPLGGPGSNPG